MNRERLASLFSDLRLGDGAAPAHGSAPFSRRELAERTLTALGLTNDDLEAIAATGEPRMSMADVGLGVGFGAWVVVQSAQSLGVDSAEKAVAAVLRHAEKWTDFLLANWDHPIDTWGDLADLARRLIEHAAALPDGSLELAADVVVAAQHSGDFWDNLEIVGAAGDAADVLDGVMTLGASLLLSWAVGKAMDKVLERSARPYQARLAALRERVTEIGRLRYALVVGLPAPAIAPQLEKVAPHHWGF
jgi:hypothetical protein